LPAFPRRGIMDKEKAVTRDAPKLPYGDIIGRLVVAGSILAVGNITTIAWDTEPYVTNLIIILFYSYLAAAFGLKGGIGAFLALCLNKLAFTVLEVSPQEASVLGTTSRLLAYGALGLIIGYLFETKIGYGKVVRSLLMSSRRNGAAALRAFSNAISVREDAGTHCERVANNAYALGKSFYGTLKEQQEVYWAGLLHDIGNIGIPDSILKKPGRLTADEYIEVKKHVQIGYEILSVPIAGLENILHGIHSHHERWDGSGYPEGLKDQSIPLIARILATVDVFEALTSVRPYRREVYGVDEALVEMKNAKGSHLDPVIVDELEKLLRKGRIAVNDESYYYPPPKVLPVGMVYDMHPGLRDHLAMKKRLRFNLLNDILLEPEQK
jgi:HD-GYP domain-containing protein (c-di-GMP phosphodiesterase class II)